jgi:hypothetical protein
MIHEGFLKLTETHFGGHPCCVVSISYKLCGPFHGGNTGSNPVGDAKSNQAVAAVSFGERGTLKVHSVFFWLLIMLTTLLCAARFCGLRACE